MEYRDHLQQLKQCPFCDPRRHCSIVKNKQAFLTYALAPYSRHHLLVIPKRHVETFPELTEEEKKDIDSLLQQGAKALEKLGHGGMNILLRDGPSSGKSIPHLHYHLIPDIIMAPLGYKGLKQFKDRPVLTKKEQEQILHDVRGALE